MSWMKAIIICAILMGTLCIENIYFSQTSDITTEKVLDFTCKLNCTANSRCISKGYDFLCVCNDGFEKLGDICKDVNECEGTNPCMQNSKCKNTDGSYECKCEDGFQLVHGVCQDINECQSAIRPCSRHAICTNILGSYSCSCKDGFSGDGYTCRDIDECMNINECGSMSHAKCVNIEGSYTCVCDDGYENKNGYCSAIDYCQYIASCQEPESLEVCTSRDNMCHRECRNPQMNIKHGCLPTSEFSQILLRRKRRDTSEQVWQNVGFCSTICGDSGQQLQSLTINNITYYRNVSCNIFPCGNYTSVNKTGNCLTIYSFSNVSLINDDLIYKVVGYGGSQVPALIDFLNGWVYILEANKILPIDQCDQIQNNIDKFKQSIAAFQNNFDMFDSIKTVFNNIIHCNGNPAAFISLFRAYRAFVKAHIIEKNLLESSQFILRSMEAKKQDCNEYKGWLGISSMIINCKDA
ncbi:latent-transforming growth factor beta-binding protein 2 isoform X2 [Hydra vulgaris]|uniref:Latent-transforming growth factor beta-binding protein 2 isoform X2 n=1 Tax=Hydra vulgaris TaxID=6087 RepID=A0ABM4CI11_HYDVU